MSEPSKGPSVQELLERIVRLENQLASLKNDFANLGAAFKAEVTNVTAEFQHDRNEFKKIYRFLADIHDQLWPVVHKVFLGSFETQQQIAAIKRNGGRSWDDDKKSD